MKKITKTEQDLWGLGIAFIIIAVLAIFIYLIKVLANFIY